jgi:hypothetical protein
MKKLDDTTLDAIAELICGSGQGSGGGYASPGPYRTMSEINGFFGRAGIEPRGESSTRKWFVLESLQNLNEGKTGNLIPVKLEQVILRLASPREYRGDAGMTQKVIEYLNQIMRVEGIEVMLKGVEPQLAARPPGVSVAPPNKPIEPPPDFGKLVSDSDLASVLSFRWQEVQRCVRVEAYLSAVVMMGSILEGVLLHKVEQDFRNANQAKAAPKDKSGKTRPIQDWGISSLIDVAHELGWLQGDVKRFSHALRESRNVVHPYVQRLLNERPDKDTCSICWQVVRAAVADLIMEDKS